MKLTKETLGILKNYATINTNILLKPGSLLQTKSPNNTIYSEAKVEEVFPTEFGIYDLNEFLGVLSIFNDPELTFNDRSLTISEGKNKIHYLPADAEVLIAPKGAPKLPVPEVEFELSAQSLQQIIKASAALKVPFMTIHSKDGNIEILVHDKANPNSNKFQLELGTTEHEFNVHVKVESLKMLPDTYTLQVTSKKICLFKSATKSYLLACEADSTFTVA